MEQQDRSGPHVRVLVRPTASRQRAEAIGDESDVRCGGELNVAVRRARLCVPREESSMSIKSKVLAAAASTLLLMDMDVPLLELTAVPCARLSELAPAAHGPEGSRPARHAAGSRWPDQDRNG